MEDCCLTFTVKELKFPPPPPPPKKKIKRVGSNNNSNFLRKLEVLNQLIYNGK